MTSKRLTVSIEQITPTKARALLLHNTHNRPMSAQTVRTYAEAMLRGEWDEHSQFVISEQNVILDGQHRLAAVAQSGVTITGVVLRGARASVQETIDTGKKRTFAHVLALRGEKNSRQLAAATRSAFRLIEGDLRNNKPVTNPQLLAFLERHPMLREHCTFPGSRGLSRIGVGIPESIAGGLHYLFSRIDSGDAEQFFDILATGVGLNPGDPILALRQRLEVTRVAAGGKPSPALIAAWVIKAWNAWQQGRDIYKLQWKVGGANPEDFPQIDGLAEALSNEDGAA